MLPDRVSNPGPLTYESGALPIALRGPATWIEGIYIFNSLLSNSLFTFLIVSFQTRYGSTAGDSVTSTVTYGWLFWIVFQCISSRLLYPQRGAPVARLSDVRLN